MMITPTALFVLIVVALTLSAIGPIVLLILLVRDWKKGLLW